MAGRPSGTYSISACLLYVSVSLSAYAAIADSYIELLQCGLYLHLTTYAAVQSFTCGLPVLILC